jgi:membrane glycosyltransferase
MSFTKTISAVAALASIFGAGSLAEAILSHHNVEGMNFVIEDEE